MIEDQRETDSELRDRLIVLVRGEIHRIEGQHPHTPNLDNIMGDVERAVVRGIHTIFKEREEL